MLDFEKYKNNLEYPTTPKRFCPGCETPFKKEQNFCSYCGNNVMSFYSEKYVKYKEALNKYQKRERDIHELFQMDALHDVGLLDHPRADKIYVFAWNKGHSSGFHDVYYWLCELSELFEDEA